MCWASDSFKVTQKGAPVASSWSLLGQEGTNNYDFSCTSYLHTLALHSCTGDLSWILNERLFLLLPSSLQKRPVLAAPQPNCCTVCRVNTGQKQSYCKDFFNPHPFILYSINKNIKCLNQNKVISSKLYHNTFSQTMGKTWQKLLCSSPCSVLMSWGSVLNDSTQWITWTVTVLLRTNRNDQ